MSTNQNPDSYENHDRLTFEAIASSIWKVLIRTQLAQLTGSRLATSCFLYYASPPSFRSCSNSLCSEILATYSEIEEEDRNMFLLEKQRQGLLSAIAALDSFLSDMLRFLFLYRPSMIPPKLQAKRPDVDDVTHVEHIVRHGELSKWKSRLKFLSAEFGVTLDTAVLEELTRLINLRNEIAHHGSGLYRFSIDEKNGQVWAEPKTLQEVSFEDAQHAHMIVAEISDTFLVAVCRRLFGDNPRVRTLTPEVEAVHKQLRAEWAVKRSIPPKIEEVLHPNWALKVSVDGTMSWVGDVHNDFIIRPTGIRDFPLILTLRKHTRHGAKAYATIDDNLRVELGMLHRQDFVEQLLAGRSLLVEFYEEPWPDPRYARYSLAGFATAWEDACLKVSNSGN